MHLSDDRCAVMHVKRGHITLYWIRSITTHRTVVANNPDIVVIEQLERRMIVDVTISHDEKLVKTDKEKHIKKKWI